ncbi:MAG: septum formation initiator family protein [Oscillospiraceae bacterium]|nr:septum formation initiator family protein [Oscillospiraceae bacterium]
MKFKRAGFSTKLIVLILLVYMAISLLTLRDQIASAQVQENELKAQVAELQEKNATLERDIANSDDPELLEKIAREQIGLVLPGEKIFVDISN